MQLLVLLEFYLYKNIMTKMKKWVVKKLSKKQSFDKASRIVLKSRLNTAIKSIKKYLLDGSVQNLHSLRITIRRLRYTMELFISCFDKKKFLIFYNEVVKIQNQTGEVRDLDVLYENISRIKLNDDINFLTITGENILAKRKNLKKEIDQELENFLKGNIIKDFNKLLA